MRRIPSRVSGVTPDRSRLEAAVASGRRTLSNGAGELERQVGNSTHVNSDAIAIDTRALAAFRILMGLLLVGDVISRSRNFSFYYTDDGVLSADLTQRLTSVRSRGNDDPVSDAFAEHLCGPVAEEMWIDVTHLQMFYTTEDITMDTLDDHESREVNFVRFYR